MEANVEELEKGAKKEMKATRGEKRKIDREREQGRERD
jgi:hypothetical protein